MSTTDHPRLFARLAGMFYLIITACAVFAYLYVRGQVIDADDMARTVASLVAQERFYRLGFAAAVIVVVCNLPMGFLLYELLKVVDPRLALLALSFIIASATLEAVNLINYIQPLFTATLPEYRKAFDAAEIEALARGPIKMFGYAFNVSLAFFGTFCALVGVLIFRSRFLPRILGVLMFAAGVAYWVNDFRLFLALPIPYVEWVGLVAEVSLALWLAVMGLNEAQWRAQAAALTPGTCPAGSG